MKDIEKAMQVALNAHSSQTDKAGEAYIMHPIRVMQDVETEEEKVVALLHDVVEDSPENRSDARKEMIEKWDGEFEMMTQQQIADALGKSQSWVSQVKSEEGLT